MFYRAVCRMSLCPVFALINLSEKVYLKAGVGISAGFMAAPWKSSPGKKRCNSKIMKT